ncbi:MAG TPA: HAD-IC family P-type ATPase [Candidatus Dormibacteraeota bacterium]|nr:HAD-IC family P-type ATPase [Candidatus Dormibacteraeota bacterium]
MAQPVRALSSVPRPVAARPSTPRGLSDAEARERAERGLSNRVAAPSSRSLKEILKANLLTRFNALLGSLLIVVLVIGPLQDAVFGIILVANALIGIAQELRSKHTLDRLAIVAAPRATVVRGGAPLTIPVPDVVQDDLLQLSAGDQVVVDGPLESDEPIEIDESLLTGEATPIGKRRGDLLLAGSFVSAGHGLQVAARVGEASYARSLTFEARRFKMVPSELMRGINSILRVVTWIIVPTALLLVVSQLRANPSLTDAVRGSVAGVITLVPEGLVLLTSASLALAVVRLGRRNVLVQQLSAVEMLARTDVLCFDKTGTLTDAEPALAGVEPLSEGADCSAALGALARADPQPNPSMRAIAAAHPAVAGWTVVSTVPFSSSRKWSAARFRDQGWWVIGAPDVLMAGAPAAEPAGRVARLSAAGHRVLVLARAQDVASGGSIRGFEAVALVSLSEHVKPSAVATIKHLRDQGVAIKLISGDHPSTVAAVAAQVGLASTAAVDGRALPTPERELVDLVERTAAFGRVSPEQKRALVRALKAAGHTVAMVGDGVNDVLALKEADLGIAMAGGSSAARAVAACILLDGSFDGVPSVLKEGRRVIGNVERLASLFFTKTVYAFLLAIAVGVAMLPFPFLPRQLTLISAFTIGIPSVFLALGPSFQPSRAGFLRMVMRFAVPAGVVAGAATFAAYALAVNEQDISISEERTVATIVIAAIGLWVLARLARPLKGARLGLVVAMTVGLAAVLLVPAARAFFDLDFPRLIVIFAATGIVALAVLGLELGDRLMTRVAGGHVDDEHIGPDPDCGRIGH